MRKLSTVAQYDIVFAPTKLHQKARLRGHIVNRVREALVRFEAAYQNKFATLDQVNALHDVEALAGEYCRKKGAYLNSPNAKHAFMFNLYTNATARLHDIQQHALAAAARLNAPHHLANLPGTARHQGGRISTGARMGAQYRVEQFVSGGVVRRTHGGDFLDALDQNVDRSQFANYAQFKQNLAQARAQHDFSTLNPMNLYTLLRAFKHKDRNARPLEYFDDPKRQTKLVTTDIIGNLVLNGNPADTRGQVQKLSYHGPTKAWNPTGVFYTQNSGGNDEYAIYVVSIDGDFYVHLDLADHAGSFQHSSIVEGKEVTCAGTVRIVNGHLKSISNNSGHYKPSASDLRDAVYVLQQELNINPRSVMATCKHNGREYITPGSVLVNNLAPGANIDTLNANHCFPMQDTRMSVDDFHQIIDATNNMETAIDQIRVRYRGRVGIGRGRH